MCVSRACACACPCPMSSVLMSCPLTLPAPAPPPPSVSVSIVESLHRGQKGNRRKDDVLRSFTSRCHTWPHLHVTKLHILNCRHGKQRQLRLCTVAGLVSGKRLVVGVASQFGDALLCEQLVSRLVSRSASYAKLVRVSRQRRLHRSLWHDLFHLESR
jgi:hypothetical protein